MSFDGVLLRGLRLGGDVECLLFQWLTWVFLLELSLRVFAYGMTLLRELKEDWRDRSVSISLRGGGGEMTLIKSVLSSLPTYFLLRWWWLID